jgi:quercetin dioxygenase-like cupin family protein
MATSYAIFPSLVAEVSIPENGILSRTLYQDDHIKTVIFGFAAGQELSAHTAPMAATLWIVEGEARLILGEKEIEVRAGCYVHMPPQLPHSVLARTPVVLLLEMHKQARS